VVTFTTPLKEVTMSIDLKDEDKYQSFLYSWINIQMLFFNKRNIFINLSFL
jgi:hypothetical protein